MHNYFFGSLSATEQDYFAAQFANAPDSLKKIQCSTKSVREAIKYQLEGLQQQLPELNVDLALRLRKKIVENCLAFNDKSVYLPDLTTIVRNGADVNIANFIISWLPFIKSPWLKGLAVGVTNLLSYYRNCPIPSVSAVKIDVVNFCKTLTDFFKQNTSQLNPEYQTQELMGLTLLIMLEAEAEYLTHHPSFWQKFCIRFTALFLIPFTAYTSAHYRVDQKPVESDTFHTELLISLTLTFVSNFLINQYCESQPNLNYPQKLDESGVLLKFTFYYLLRYLATRSDATIEPFMPIIIRTPLDLLRKILLQMKVDERQELVTRRTSVSEFGAFLLELANDRYSKKDAIEKLSKELEITGLKNIIAYLRAKRHGKTRIQDYAASNSEQNPGSTKCSAPTGVSMLTSSAHQEPPQVVRLLLVPPTSPPQPRRPQSHAWMYKPRSKQNSQLVDSFYQAKIRALQVLCDEYKAIRTEHTYLARHIDLQICNLNICIQCLALIEEQINKRKIDFEILYQTKYKQQLEKIEHLTKLSTSSFGSTEKIITRLKALHERQFNELVALNRQLTNDLPGQCTEKLKSPTSIDKVLYFFADFFPPTLLTDNSEEEFYGVSLHILLNNIALDLMKKNSTLELLLHGTRIFSPKKSDDIDLMVIARHGKLTTDKRSYNPTEITSCITSLFAHYSWNLIKKEVGPQSSEEGFTYLQFIYSQPRVFSTIISVTIYNQSNLDHSILNMQQRLVNVAAATQSLTTDNVMIDPHGLEALQKNQIEYLDDVGNHFLDDQGIPYAFKKRILAFKCTLKTDERMQVGSNLKKIVMWLEAKPVEWLRLGKVVLDNTHSFKQVLMRWEQCMCKPLQLYLDSSDLGQTQFAVTLFPQSLDSRLVKQALQNALQYANESNRGFFLFLLSCRNAQLPTSINLHFYFNTAFGLAKEDQLGGELAKIYHSFYCALSPEISTNLERSLMNLFTTYFGSFV
jgi:hypothetical protein